MIYTDRIHLVGDTLEELHAFAQAIGLKREWFQQHQRHPHYDLTSTRMALKAATYGARVVTSKELVRKVHACMEREGNMAGREISCPECGEIGEVAATTESDEDGVAEFRCGACGHYFTEMVRDDDEYAVGWHESPEEKAARLAWEAKHGK